MLSLLYAAGLILVKLHLTLELQSFICPIPFWWLRQQEVTGVAGCNMRSDFVVSFEDGSAMAVEVKTVVDTDFAPHTAPVLTAGERKKRCVYVGNGVPYQRAAIFPWGTQKQALDPNDKSSPKARYLPLSLHDSFCYESNNTQ
jgi:hypothetical protein